MLSWWLKCLGFGFFTLRKKKKMVLLWIKLNRSKKKTLGKRRGELEKEYIHFGLAQDLSMISVRKGNTAVCGSKRPHL